MASADEVDDDPRLDLFEIGLATTLAGLAGGGLLGLLLAVAGVFAWVAVAVAGVAVAAATAWLTARPGLRPMRAPAAVVAALLVAGVAGGVAVEHRGAHVLTDRDPGVYAVTALWMVSEGSLVVDDGLDAGTSGTDRALGFKDHAGDHAAHPQFPHLFPTYLATAAGVAGDGALFAVPGLFGALGLLAVFALGRELVRPWAAVGATALVAVTLPQVQLARDVYSELPAQAFVFGGLWSLAVAWRRGSRPIAVVAGVLLGAGVGIRIDLMLGLLALVVLDAAARRRPELRRVRTAAVAGAVVAGAVCALDLGLRGRLYVRELAPEAAALFAVVVAAAILARVAPRLRLDPRVAAAGVAAFVAYAWLLRPHVETVRGDDAAIVRALQASDGVAVDGTRRYGERSFVWLTWYLGAPAVAVAAFGWCAAAREAVLRRAPAVRVLVVVLTVAAGMALLRPSISPDHPWAMRRYLPLVVPGLCLCLVLLVDRVVGASRSRAWLGAAALVALAVPAVAVTERTLDARPRDGLLELVSAACAEAGDGAVFAVPDDSFTEEQASMALRAVCGRPVAGIASLGDAAALGDDVVAVELRYDGLGDPPFVADPDVDLATSDDLSVRRTIVRAPSSLESLTWHLLLWRPPAT